MSKDELGREKLEELLDFLEALKINVHLVPDIVWIDGWKEEDEDKFQQIRQLIEMQVEVDKAFIEKWLGRLGSGGGGHGYPTFWEALEAILQEAGVKFKK